MNKDVHPNTSQLVMLDFNGTILKSCDTLFTASNEMGKNLFITFPVLKSMQKEISGLQKNDIPLFMPHVAFSHRGYSSICDFVFMKDGFGLEDVVVWMITDNAKHYRCLLNEKKLDNKKSLYEQYNNTNKGYMDNFL